MQINKLLYNQLLRLAQGHSDHKIVQSPSAHDLISCTTDTLLSESDETLSPNTLTSKLQTIYDCGREEALAGAHAQLKELLSSATPI